MKKLILLLIVFEIASIQIFMAQEVNTLQPYKVMYLKYNKQTSTKIYGAENFKLGIKQAYHDSYFTDEVNIYYILKTRSDGNIYTNENNSKSIKFSIAYHNKIKILKSNINFHIPFDDMNMMEGKHKLQLEIYIENDSLKDVLLIKKEVIIDKPKLFKFDEQEVTISNIQTSINTKVLGLRGIKIRFDKKFKFSANQTKGISRDKNLGNYYLKVKVYNKTNNKNCYELQEKQLSIKKVFAKNANTYSQTTLFIPYRNIQLTKGTHDIKIEINASDKEGFFEQNSIASKYITINQPQVYYAFIDVSKFNVAYAKYDVSSSFVRYFSKADSKKGSGYPDLYWNIKIGNYTIYKTYVNKNSYTAAAGSYKFKMVDDDYVNVNVYDRDISSLDDFIGKFEIKNKIGDFEIKNKKISTSEISNLTYNFIKSIKPIKNKEQNSKTVNLPDKIDISYKIDSINELKKEDIPGVLINLSTKKPNSFINKDTTKYFLTTIDIKNKSGNKKYNYYYINELKKYNTLVKPYYEFFNLNNENNLKLFLPYSSIETDKNKYDFKIDFKTYIIDDTKLKKEKIDKLKQASILTNSSYFGKKIFVGKQTESFNIKGTQLVKIKFINANFKTTSSVNYNSYTFTYFFSYSNIFTTKCKKVPNENLLLINSELTTNKKDKLNISISYRKDNDYRLLTLFSKTINLAD